MAFSGMLMTIMGQPIVNPSNPNAFTFNAPSFTSGQELNLTSTYDNPKGLCVKTDGTYIAAYDDNGSVHRLATYQMSPAFDLSSASVTPSNFVTLSSNGRGLFIEDNALNLYFCRALGGTDKLFKVVMDGSTNWGNFTVSGTTFAKNLNVGTTNNLTSVSGMSFYNSGTGDRVVVSGSGPSSTYVIHIYSITNVGVASQHVIALLSEISFSNAVSRPEGLDVKPDGSKLFTIDDLNDTIIEYDISNDVINPTPVNTKSIATILGAANPTGGNWRGLSIDRTNGLYTFITYEDPSNNSWIFRVDL